MELDRSNKAVIHQLDFAEVKDRLPAGMDEAGWHAVRPNLGTVAEAGEWWRLVTGPITQPEFSDEDRAYLAEAARLLVRSEEHTSELQSLMRISYAVFCLKKKNKHNNTRKQ